MLGIQRLGDSPRWSDVVIYRGLAKWVEVASDRTLDFRGQVRQVLEQIDQTLLQVGSSRSQLLQVLIFVGDLRQMGDLNAEWDSWVERGAAPIRACVQAGMGNGCLVEMVIEAAVPVEE